MSGLGAPIPDDQKTSPTCLSSIYKSISRQIPECLDNPFKTLWRQQVARGQTVGYVRVSSIDQKEARQLEGLTVDKVFTDKASGEDTNRPQLERALEFLREGDTLVVHSMDRLARNLDDLRRIVLTLTAKAVRVQFLKKSLTFIGEDSPMSNLMLSIMGAFAQFQRELIKERQREGIAIAKKRVFTRNASPALLPNVLRTYETGRQPARTSRRLRESLGFREQLCTCTSRSPLWRVKGFRIDCCASGTTTISPAGVHESSTCSASPTNPALRYKICDMLHSHESMIFRDQLSLLQRSPKMRTTNAAPPSNSSVRPALKGMIVIGLVMAGIPFLIGFSLRAQRLGRTNKDQVSPSPPTNLNHRRSRN